MLVTQTHVHPLEATQDHDSRDHPRRSNRLERSSGEVPPTVCIQDRVGTEDSRTTDGEWVGSFVVGESFGKDLPRCRTLPGGHTLFGSRGATVGLGSRLSPSKTTPSTPSPVTRGGSPLRAYGRSLLCLHRRPTTCMWGSTPYVRVGATWGAHTFRSG